MVTFQVTQIAVGCCFLSDCNVVGRKCTNDVYKGGRDLEDDQYD